MALVGALFLCLALLLMFFMWLLAPLRPQFNTWLYGIKAKLPKLPEMPRRIERREPMVLDLDIRDKDWSEPITGPH